MRNLLRDQEKKRNPASASTNPSALGFLAILWRF
jgi:hypothetical protein